MNVDILLQQNVQQICFETVDVSNLSISVVTKSITKYFTKYLLCSKNVYISSFILNRLSKIAQCGKCDVYRKILVEVYLLLSLCNKPIENEEYLKYNTQKINKNEDCKKMLQKEMKSNRHYDKIMTLVSKLEKTEKEFLWKYIYSLSSEELNKRYVKNLFELYKIEPCKQFLFAAYKSLYIVDYVYDVTAYHKVIFQCMLKINYLYKYEDVQRDIYVTCLNYIPRINDSITSNKYLMTYIADKKKVLIEYKTKSNEDIIFEKIN